ncbi:MAG: PIN domain-containing protein [Anaerolineales bacterium]|jgi:predicted nucleic acid-binding protein
MISVLIDTNLLVYMYDLSEPEKRRRSINVLQSVHEAESGALSAQALSEFYNVVTRKLAPPLTATQAEDQLHRLARVWPVFPVTTQVVFEAARGSRRYKFSFWDAQIWAVARLNHISLVLSEDFSPDAVIEGVRFVNPLADDSRPADWEGRQEADQ